MVRVTFCNGSEVIFLHDRYFSGGRWVRADFEFPVPGERMAIRRPLYTFWTDKVRKVDWL